MTPATALHRALSCLAGVCHCLGERFGLLLAGTLVTAAVAGLYVAWPDWMDFQDHKIYDELLTRHRPVTRSRLPLVVDIDEASLAAYGQWPWPRYRVALLLGLLRNAGVAAVGLDIVFAEPDRASPGTITGQLFRDLKVEATVTGLPEALRDYDRVLADMLGSGPFVLGTFLHFGTVSAALTPQREPGCALPPSRLSVLGDPGAKPLPDCLPEASRMLCPLPLLARAAPAAGFINAQPDRDNIVRRSPLVLGYQGEPLPSLALATVMEAFQVKNAVLRLTAGGLKSLTLRSDRLGTRVIPLDARGQVLLNFRGPSGVFPHRSAGDILAGRVAPENLQGRIVFIGTSAAALRDLRASPLDRDMPGVEIHATIADMIAADDFLLRPDWAPGLELSALIVLGLVSAGLLAYARAAILLVPFLGLGLAIWYGAGMLLAEGRLYVSPLCPLLVLGLNFACLTFLKFWREERQKRYLHGAFSRYVAPAVVARLVANPKALTLSGEEREVTILFSDVRGFTSISERLSPTQVAELLHRYFTPMTRIIVAHLGTMDKFIGDAIMAFWNAPLDVADHPAKAVTAALAMAARLDQLNQAFAKDFGFTIASGIGLHKGRVRVGNFGSEDLFDYTVIGDAVNLASRLEGLTKFYGVRILATDGIREAAPDAAAYEEIDQVRVKGKAVAVTLYAVLSREERRARTEELDAAAAARALYKDRRFVAAADAYRELAARHGHRFYTVFAERAAGLAATPPPGDWDGVFEHTEK
ncbi:MAG: CHASE2 domain-containing protein [Desulfovibrionaceae bacterium]